MNTKQVLYNALFEQLEIKRKEVEKYDLNIQTPALNQLSSKIEEWFQSNMKNKFHGFKYENSIIYFFCDNSHDWNTTKIKIDYFFDDNRERLCTIKLDTPRFDINFNDKNDLKHLEHIQFNGELVEKIKVVKDKILNEWNKEYNNIKADFDKIRTDHKQLENALSTLKWEIKNEVMGKMKEIGFEIKSFKPWVSYDSRLNCLIDSDHIINLQVGRSRYDNVSTKGFKVLDKKGNKYKIEVINNYNNIREYNVLEKKFDNFIHNVYEWENEGAEYRKKDYEKYIK